MKNSINIKNLEREVSNINIDWKIWEEKTDYKIYFIDEKSGLRSIKSEIIINKPLKEVFDFIGNLENKSKYDKNFDTGHTIKTIINEQYNLSYQKLKLSILRNLTLSHETEDVQSTYRLCCFVL